MVVLNICLGVLVSIPLNCVNAKAIHDVPQSCQDDINWALKTGKLKHPEWYPNMEETCGVSVKDASFEDLQRYFKCKNVNSIDCNDKGLLFPKICTSPPCDVCTIVPPIPSSCQGHLDWAFSIGKSQFPQYYSKMGRVCGVLVQDAKFEDFQRLFKCENINSEDCNDQGLQFPDTCTNLPCDTCYVEKCCAGEEEDIYNPNVCQGTNHPVDCCAGFEQTFIPGPNNYICKAKSTVAPTTETPSTEPPSTDDPFGVISINRRNIMVNGKIFYMKGVNWNPVPKGRTHPPRHEDFVHFAKMDAPKMKEAGINIVRTYATVTSKEVLNIFVNNGIRVVNPINPLDSLHDIMHIVLSLKDHPGVFMWALGNEWNYNKCYANISEDDCANKIREASKEIKSIDSNHPVSTIYGELPTTYLINSMKYIDAWGLNIYSGDSFGDRFNKWSEKTNKPMYIGEYGADAWNANINQLDEDSQSVATTRLINEIKDESTRNGGPCTGGIIFEWADEWWKAGNPSHHDKGGIAPGGGPYPDFTFNEEYWGLMTIDRVPRKAYYAYKQA